MARLTSLPNLRRYIGATLLIYGFGCGKPTGATQSQGVGSGPRQDEDGGADDHNPQDREGKDAGANTAKATRDAGQRPNSDPAGDPGSADPAPKELVRIDDCAGTNAAGLDVADVTRLQSGGSPAGMSFLYPYDQTVFPRGLTAPLLMWAGGAGQAVYVRIRSKYLEYDGCLAATGDGQLQLPQDVWDKAGEQTMGPATPFKVELSTLDGQDVHGPITETIVIAQATLKGSIYYNSYNSSLGGLLGLPAVPGLNGDNIATNGSVLRIKPGKSAEFFAQQDTCTGCHAVSANGERLISSQLLATGQVYKLQPDSAPNPDPALDITDAAFVGLSPDGSVFISSAASLLLGPSVDGGDLPATASAALYETDTGQIIDGAGIPAMATMPTFSVNGRAIVFTDLTDGDGNTLVLMDYDPAQRRAANQRTLYTSAQGYAGWPFLLPDDGAVIFTEGEASNFSGLGAYLLGLNTPGPRSDLMIVDVQTGKATILAQAMGFRTPEDASNDNTYLPFGAEELHQHYYPTVSPVAAGGYFWVFFDSIRHYGNLGMHRQLWGAAIKVQGSSGEFANANGAYALDPSSPAFYLPGQELNSANHRAFTALDPCREEGASCDTGIDCCSGFCTDGVCGPPRECAQTNEACHRDEDCCSSEDECIGGFCGSLVLL